MSRRAALEALVGKHFPGNALLACSTLTGGVAADVSRLEIGVLGGPSRHITLREHGPTYPGLPIDIEYELLHALVRAGLRVPRPIAMGASAFELANPYLLLEFVEGDTAIPADDNATYVSAMADQLAAIHQVSTASLPSLPERVDPVPELLQWLDDGTDWVSLRGRVAELQNTAFTGNPALLHGDFWPHNVIWDDGAIAAVIDWEDAALGDPLSDIACTALELRYVFGKDGEALFLEAYARRAPIDRNRLALWQIYVAVAGCRSMGEWGLEPTREAKMRHIAREVIVEASAALG